MSEGPIKQQRDAWKPPKVSTRPRAVKHAPMRYGSAGLAACGRNFARELSRIALPLEEVTCSDCLAAMRADGAAR